VIELTRDKLQKAIEKAKQERNHVRPLTWRRYEVTTPKGGIYTVTFDVRKGRKYGACNCKAGQREMACYHLASAIAVHLAIAKMRAVAERPGLKREETAPAIRFPRECTHATCRGSRCREGLYLNGIAV